MSRPLYTLIVAILLVASAASAQTETPAALSPAVDVPEAFASPKATLRTFIEAMSQDPPDRARGVQCMDISMITADAAPDLAWHLYRCINRIEFITWSDPMLFDEADVATEPERVTWTFYPPPKAPRDMREYRRWNELRELAPDARIDLRKQEDGRWLFSQQTVEGIDTLWEKIQPLPPVSDAISEEFRTLAERIESLWPESFSRHRFLGVKAWQWLSLFVLILAGIVLDQIVRLILTIVSHRVIARQRGEARRETIRKAVRPFGLLSAALLWLWFGRYLGLPPGALAVVMTAARLFATLAAVWSAYRLTDLVSEVLASKAESTDTKFDDLLVPLVRKAVKVFVAVIGMIYVAQSMNIGIAPLLTGLGIGGAGFAFAAKDTLEHFFGSITVIADRPFQVGDWVQIGDVEGTVEEVGFRSTRVRTFYNSLMTVPNGNLVRAVVDNYGLRKYRRWKTHINITYGTPPERIEAFCEGIRELIRMHPYTRKDYYQVWLHQFGPHSLDVLVYAFHEAPDWQTELRERHRLMIDIIHLANRLGVEFAYPTQTIELSQLGERPEPDKPADPGVTTDTQAMRLGQQTVHELTARADWRGGKPAPYRIRHSSVDLPGDDETQIESKIGGDA